MKKEKQLRQNSTQKGVIFVIIAVFFWGISFISTKVLLQEYRPVSIAFFRQFVALVPLTILFVRRRAFFKIQGKTILHMATASLFGIVLYFVFENTGVNYLSVSEASMIVSTIPIFTMLMDTVVNRKKLEWRTLLLVLCSWVGVYFIIAVEPGEKAGTDQLKGSLMVFGAMVSWIVYTLVSKRLGEKYDSLQMTFAQTLLSIPLFIPFVWGDQNSWHWPSGIAMVHLVFLGIFCSAVAYVLFLHGISTLGPGVASSYLNLVPLVTLAAGSIFLGDALAPLQWVGAFLIMVSLGLISFFKMRQRTKDPAEKAVQTSQ